MKSERYGNRMSKILDDRLAWNNYCTDWLKKNTKISDEEIKKAHDDMNADKVVFDTLGNDDAWFKFCDEHSAWQKQRQNR